MSKVLTDRTCIHTKPRAKRYELPDGGSGLYFIVQPSGKKSWAARYRHGSRPRKLTIGPYPRVGLALARKMAAKALIEASEGGDPAGDKRRRKQAVLGEDAFATIADGFVRHAATRNKSWAETKRLLDKEVLPTWGTKQLDKIRKRDVLALLESIVQRGSPFTANRVLKIVRRLCSWAVAQDILTANPCQGVEPPAVEVSRDRILNDNELRWLWQAAGDIGEPFGAITKLLILTGQRRSEVAGMADAELAADGTWTIPAARTKNAREHAVPLPPAAKGILAKVPRLAGTALLFTTTGKTPVSGFSDTKQRLDAAMLARAKAEGVETITPWTFHDLRRTAASGMAKLGIAVHVTEATLNHKSGKVSGIAAVYNRYDYAEEKRHALNAWAAHLERIVQGQPVHSNVSYLEVG